MLLRSLRRPAPVSALSLAVRGFSTELRKTPLYDYHVEHGAKTTGFGGWDMPLNYTAGGMKEHLFCREKAGLFDVSHMVPIRIHGKDRVKFAERVLVADVEALPEGMGSLSSLPNEQGGLIDDLIVTNAGDHLYMVINAGHEDKDIPHMQKYMKEFGDVCIEPLEGRGILALQGPLAAKVMSTMCDADMSSWSFMSARNIKVNGVDCFVSRSGYTGEDGFEIMCEGKESLGLAEAMMATGEVGLTGLGARDSLRLEAGLCLYGNDMDDTTSPSEAGLLWTIPKSRRAEGRDNFVGAGRILGEIKDKKLVQRKRVGFVNKGPPARSHDKIFDMEGNEVGEITSGVFGPTVKHNCSMGYVKKAHAKKGTDLQVEIRGKMRPLKVTPMPFTPANFFRG